MTFGGNALNINLNDISYSDEAKALLGETVAAALRSQIDQIGKALVEGGDANAENFGNQLGQVVAIVASPMMGGGTSSANKALKLSEMGIHVSASTVKKCGASLGSGRLEKAVDVDTARDVATAIKTGRTETWVVTTQANGSTEIQVLDSLGRPKPIDTSKILVSKTNLSGAQP